MKIRTGARRVRPLLSGLSVLQAVHKLASAGRVKPLLSGLSSRQYADITADSWFEVARMHSSAFGRVEQANMRSGQANNWFETLQLRT